MINGMKTHLEEDNFVNEYYTQSLGYALAAKL
mgnify:CR=1 FL=1